MSSIADVLAGLQATSGWQEDVYKQLHAHPELSFQETKTAALAASKLKELGYEVSKGLVGPASSASCETAKARPCSRGLTWTRFPLRKTPVCLTPRH